VSNEQAVQTDVYFDDVKMTYTPTNILQSNEYYPFGLQTANSWTRDNTTNNFLYNSSSELNTTTAMYDLPFRNYDAALGRFFQVDPLAHTSSDLTPYHYANNNPVAFNDPSGAVVPYYAKPEDDPRNWRMTITNGLYYGDGWSFSFTPGNGGSAAASLDEAANVSQYWTAVNEARLAANLAKANSDGVMLMGAAARSFFNAWKKSEWVMIDQKGGAVTLYYQLTQGGVSLLAFNGRLGDYLTQSGNPGTPWMRYAISQLGITEANNPNKVVGYFSATNYEQITGVKPTTATFWCAAFANWCLQQAGIQGPGTASSWDFNDWKGNNWGEELDQPVFGAIGVNSSGHTVFYLFETSDGHAAVLGGNQSNSVNILTDEWMVSDFKWVYPPGYSH